jgi:hypothetical protein
VAGTIAAISTQWKNTVTIFCIIVVVGVLVSIIIVMDVLLVFVILLLVVRITRK